jgi:hypothetical protein
LIFFFETIKDSIIFSHKPGEYRPTIGNNLGEFTNEIKPTKGSYIKRFVSGGRIVLNKK